MRRRKGVYLFHGMADARSSEKGTNVHGLFGAVIVEPSEARWLDPETGEELESGLFADIYTPGQPAFREYAVFFHDELEIKGKDGQQPMDPFSRVIPMQGGISIGNKFDMELEHGAAAPGDYLYRSGSFKWDVESGMWGIFRVMKQGIRCRCKNIYQKAAGRFQKK